jgi:hypothetical protein
MGFLRKIFKGKPSGSTAAAVEEPACLHVTLVPRWDNAEDIGKNDKASSFICEACKQSFTGDVARSLLADEKRRVAAVLAEEAEAKNS